MQVHQCWLKQMLVSSETCHRRVNGCRQVQQKYLVQMIVNTDSHGSQTTFNDSPFSTMGNQV